MAETTQVANQEPQTFSVALTEKLNSVAEALPKDFNKARFVQNALALVMIIHSCRNIAKHS